MGSPDVAALISVWPTQAGFNASIYTTSATTIIRIEFYIIIFTSRGSVSTVEDAVRTTAAQISGGTSVNGTSGLSNALPFFVKAVVNSTRAELNEIQPFVALERLVVTAPSASPSPSAESSSSRSLAAILGGIIAGLIILLVIIVALWCLCKKKGKKVEKPRFKRNARQVAPLSVP
jgi:hypothetical protein